MLKFHEYTVIGTANGRKTSQLAAVEPEITVDLLPVDIPIIVRNVSYLAKPLIAFQLTQGIPKMLEESTDASSTYRARMQDSSPLGCSALQNDAGVWGSTLNNWSKVTTGECALFHSPSPKFT